MLNRTECIQYEADTKTKKTRHRLLWPLHAILPCSNEGRKGSIWVLARQLKLLPNMQPLLPQGLTKDTYSTTTRREKVTTTV